MCKQMVYNEKKNHKRSSNYETINFNQSKIVPRKLFNYPERDPMFSLGTALQY